MFIQAKILPDPNQIRDGSDRLHRLLQWLTHGRAHGGQEAGCGHQGQPQADAAVALELLWQFLELGETVLGLCDDSSGLFGDIFRGAIRQFSPIAKATRPDPTALAEQRAISLPWPTRASLRAFDTCSPGLRPW